MPAGKKFGGRKAGTVNKRTAESINIALEIVNTIIEDHLESDIKKLTPRERMSLLSDMHEYIRPKLSRQDINADLKINNKTILEIVRRSNSPESAPPEPGEDITGPEAV